MTEAAVQTKPVERKLTTGYFSSFVEASDQLTKTSPDEILKTARLKGVLDWAMSGETVSVARGIVFSINTKIADQDIFSERVRELAEAEAKEKDRLTIAQNLSDLSRLGRLVQTEGKEADVLSFRKKLDALIKESPYSLVNYLLPSLKWVWGFKPKDTMSEVSQKSDGGRRGDSQDYTW